LRINARTTLTAAHKERNREREREYYCVTLTHIFSTNCTFLLVICNIFVHNILRNVQFFGICIYYYSLFNVQCYAPISQKHIPFLQKTKAIKLSDYSLSLVGQPVVFRCIAPPSGGDDDQGGGGGDGGGDGGGGGGVGGDGGGGGGGVVVMVVVVLH